MQNIYFTSQKQMFVTKETAKPSPLYIIKKYEKIKLITYWLNKPQT